jgi:hypothetical protein
MIFCCCKKPPCGSCEKRCFPGYGDFPKDESEPPYEYEYEYMLIICNANAARDDEWSLSFNGNNWGNVSELGIDRCQGKIFHTNKEFLDDFIEVFDSELKSNLYSFCGVPRCCVQGTIGIKAFSEVSKNDFLECKDNILVMTVTKANNNGNFGYIMVFRGKYRKIEEETKRKFISMCLLGTTQYGAGGKVGDVVRYDAKTKAMYYGGPIDWYPPIVMSKAMQKCGDTTEKGKCRPISSGSTI